MAVSSLQRALPLTSRKPPGVSEMWLQGDGWNENALVTMYQNADDDEEPQDPLSPPG